MKKPHRFAIGQSIEVRGKRTGPSIPAGTYTVVRLVPNDGADREYIVRSKSEPHDRVVAESLIQPVPQGYSQKVFS